MTTSDSNSAKTLSELLDLARSTGNLAEPLQQSLAWLVAGRLAAYGLLPSDVQLSSFLSPDGWRQLQDIGIPADVCDQVIRGASDQAFARRAYAIVSDRVEQLPNESWSLPDAAWIFRSHLRGAGESSLAFDPSFCDLLVEVSSATPQDFVLVPFDHSGQITTRLVTLGAKVLAAGPGYRNSTIAALVLALENGDALSRVRFGGMDGAHEVGNTEISHCICAGPMNYKVPKSMDWRRWQDSFTKYRDLNVSADEMDRSDAWTVAAFWPQIRDRAVFVCIPGLLFSQGQEMRLRKALVHPKNQISSAMSLPQNMLSGTAVAPVLLTLDANTDDSVRMIDLSGPIFGGRANPKFGKDLSVKDVMDLYEHGNEKPYLSCNASIQDIEACDYSLMPTRYTRRVADLGGDRVKLGDLLLETVRSPVPTKDGNGVAVWEVGITLLDRWQPIEQHFERHMQLQAKKSEQSLLRDRDIVLSIKGTVGKAGLIGQLVQNLNPDSMWSDNPGVQSPTPVTNAAVPAASCIALRVNPAKVIPEYLLLFLRSDDFKNQLESLRVGAAIAHITPSSLLNSILVPLPSIEIQSELWESTYLELRELEEKSDQITERMNVIRDGLFRNSN